jgi:protein involved in sex pheromone biosynthesis
MKKTMYLFFLPAVLFLGSCNSGTQVSNEEKEKETAEIKASDSLTTELENVKGEIESKTTELDDVLNSLEPVKK